MANSLGSVVSSMQVNVVLTSPSILDALFTALDARICNFRSRSMVTPKSFPSVIASRGYFSYCTHNMDLLSLDEEHCIWPH